jgi:peptide/nickel transport system substrate-binding protein
VPAEVFDAFQKTPARGQVHLDSMALVRAVVMNVAVPPFTDVNVRRAVNLAIDKQHLVDLQGGPVARAVTGHLAPDATEGGLLADYDPYRTPGHAGDIAAARREMAKATDFDTNGDGRCDVPACLHVRAITRDPYGAVARAVTDDLKGLGINLEVEIHNDTFFSLAADPRAKVPFTIGMGYGATGWISASGFMSLFDGPLAFGMAQGKESGNTTMVGATPDQLRGWGYTVTDVPNVDKRVDGCLPLVRAQQFACWAAVDQYLMEQVVPWVPLSVDLYAAISSPRVHTYGFDELMETTSLDQLALQP